MKNIRVLIVDDVPQVRHGLLTMLRLASKKKAPTIEVIGEAQNGYEAIQLSQAMHPDAILMDLEMPILDGYSATQSIKLIDPSIFIIILTIHDDPQARQKAAQVGADAFVVKSAPLDGLIRSIQSINQKVYKEAL